MNVDNWTYHFQVYATYRRPINHPRVAVVRLGNVTQPVSPEFEFRSDAVDWFNENRAELPYNAGVKEVGTAPERIARA